MSTEVITRSRCDRCGRFDERNGAEGETPPVHWARIEIVFRREGSGWTNTYPHRFQFCHDCAIAIKDFAYSPPVTPSAGGSANE